MQITALDAPSAEGMLQFVSWPILSELERHNRLEQTYHMQLALGKAQRRIRAYKEITQRILPTPTPAQPSDTPKMAFDLYNDPPFVLFYQFLNHETDYGAAVQLDQQVLLEDFMQRLEGLSAFAVIEDSEGNIIMGQANPDEITTTVPFPRTLSYLRVGLHKSVIDQQLDGLSDQWLTPLVITLCLIIGFVALSAQTRASREQQLLFESSTRVHDSRDPRAQDPAGRHPTDGGKSPYGVLS